MNRRELDKAREDLEARGLYHKFTPDEMKAEIRRVIGGKKPRGRATLAVPEVLVEYLAGLLGVRYQPYRPPDPRFKRVWRDRYVGDTAQWCERLYKLPDPRRMN